MNSGMNYTAMRVKQYDTSIAVEVSCIENRTNKKTDCLLIIKSMDDIVYYGADIFHPLIKAEMKEAAFEAIKVGMGKAQLEAKQSVSELESSRKRQANRANQFHEAISAWSDELSSLNTDVRNGLDTPSIRSRLSTLSASMAKLNPRK